MSNRYVMTKTRDVVISARIKTPLHLRVEELESVRRNVACLLRAQFGSRVTNIEAKRAWKPKTVVRNGKRVKVPRKQPMIWD